jgi:phosphoribosylanthranilate isomerase
VDAIGINLWSGSSRGLTLVAAQEMLARAGPGTARRVGVFVDPEPEFVSRAVDLLGLDFVQPHGDRPATDYAKLGCPYIWVIRGTPELETLEVPDPAPRWAILDAASERFGGEGRLTDWTWARRAVEHLAPLPVWLAGGIRPNNAAKALADVAPAGLDVASGAEMVGARRGQKDVQNIQRLLELCRSPPEA